MKESRESRSERIKKGKLRHGWTTGTCASASAKTATLLLLGKDVEGKISVPLPMKGRRAEIEIFKKQKLNGEAIASVIKDAGDDPDVTHGAEIGARVFFSSEGGIKIVGGEGVGIVTKPGLSVEVGQHDITPVPRKQIKRAVEEAIAEAGLSPPEVSLTVEIFVPEGKERAKKTMLEKLGVVGGIGILGTLGIVVPYSTGAWRATIARQISVAVKEGLDTIVATTGRQSEERAKKLLGLPDVAFIDIGDFIGYTLSWAKRKGIKKFIYAGFLAKLSKVAKGEVFTHAKKSAVDINFLVELAKKYTSEKSVIEDLLRSNTAREFAQKAKKYGLEKVFFDVAELVRRKCKEMSGLDVEVIIFDLDSDRVLARVG